MIGWHAEGLDANSSGLDDLAKFRFGGNAEPEERVSDESGGSAPSGQAVESSASSARLARWFGGGLVLLSAALIVAGIVAFQIGAQGTNLVPLQWAGSETAARAVVPLAAYARYRAALSWDLGALIPGYALGLVVAAYLGSRVFWTRRMQKAAGIAVAAAIVAGLCNAGQDLLLLRVLGHVPIRGTWEFGFAESLSFVKFSLLIVAAGVGLVALATTASRLAGEGQTRERWKAALGDRPRPAPRADFADLVIGPPPAECAPRQVRDDLEPDASWWNEDERSGLPHSHWNQNSSSPADSQRGLGICVSGGGIRSASVALGALQALQGARTATDGTGPSELGRARYLVSVSGGGYTAAAFQIALHAGTPAADVFAPGSPEEDHLRRHSSYLADTLGQWLTLLGVFFRCVAAGVALIGLTVAVAGLAIGRFYREVPVIKGGLARLRPLFLVHARLIHGKPTLPPSPAWPGIPWGVTLAVLAVTGLAVLAFAVQVCSGSAVSRATARAGRYLVDLALLLAAIGIAIPGLMWLSAWLSWHTGFSRAPVITAGSLTVLVGYLGALAGTLWRKRATITKTVGNVGTFFTRSPGGQVLPNSMIQMVLLWLCLAVLLVAAALLSGWVATSGLDASWWALLPAGVLLVPALFIDETWLSLYPFYRRRLASAFDVGRCQTAGVPAARPLIGQATRLSECGKQVAGFPEVRFLAAANVTGQDRTPPGRRAVSFALDAQWVGGPQAGWVRTDFLEALAAPSIKRDIEVDGARSISGAAFAAAMGSQTRFYEVFLALANVRLGAWLPNPYFVALKAQHQHDWTVPGLPSRRRLSHLAREILGIHPSSARMLLCTDGGHYENLGLMELLRLRCTEIYCFDASAGGAPLADTLAGVLALAREELGASVTFDGPYDLAPGCAGRPQLDSAGALASLDARISKTAVITGTIRYADNTAGKIVFAQAALTTDLPYQVIDYAQRNDGFPRDGTADQWFDAGQFNAYQQLGRYLGDRAFVARRW